MGLPNHPRVSNLLGTTVIIAVVIVATVVTKLRRVAQGSMSKGQATRWLVTMLPTVRRIECPCTLLLDCAKSRSIFHLRYNLSTTA